MKPIKIVVPDGSMQEVVTGLLNKAGLPVSFKQKRTKEGSVPVDWIEQVVFQRPQEIPLYIRKGHFDLAIVGEDWISNWGLSFPVLLKLPIGRSGSKPVRIVVAVSQTSPINTLEDLPRGSEIATEYVKMAERLFFGKGMFIIPSYGNTEHKIRYGADAIIDVTESGESLVENGLKIIHTIMESHTVIVANDQSLTDPSKKFYIETFTELIKGAAQASQYVLIIANVPDPVLDQACKLIKGLKGPSYSPLKGEMKGWSALQSIVPKKGELDLILKLRALGVTDIIVSRDLPLIMS